jgi:hypothetical protein
VYSSPSRMKRRSKKEKKKKAAAAAADEEEDARPILNQRQHRENSVMCGWVVHIEHSEEGTEHTARLLACGVDGLHLLEGNPTVCC